MSPRKLLRQKRIGPEWSNGSLVALKKPCPKGRAGSNPASGTNPLSLTQPSPRLYRDTSRGAVAQLGEHKAGSLGVRGSNPLSSTNSQHFSGTPAYSSSRRRPRIVGECRREAAIVAFAPLALTTSQRLSSPGARTEAQTTLRRASIEAAPCACATLPSEVDASERVVPTGMLA